MARIRGYPDPNAAGDPQNAPGRLPQPDAGTFGSGHATGTGSGTGYKREDASGSYGHDGSTYGGVGRGAGGYGTNDGYGLEHQQPTIDQDTRMGADPRGRGSLSPMRARQATGSETGQPSMPQAEIYTPTQQVTRDISPDSPPQPQAHAADNDKRPQMYQ